LEKSQRFEAMIDLLLKISFARYEDVRRHAQHGLLQALKTFPSSRRRVLHAVLDVMKPPEAMSDTYVETLKGAIQLLHNRTFRKLCIRDVELQRSFQTTIVQAHHVDRPEVQDAIRKVFVEYMVNFARPGLDALPGVAGLPVESKQAVDDARAKLEKRLQRYKQAHSDMMKEMINLARSLPHWRYQAMAANLLEVDQRAEHGVHPDLAKLFLEMCISEIPAIRKVAMSATNKMLLALKQRANKNGQSLSKVVKRKEAVTDEIKEMYHGKGDRFIDDMYLGALCWPDRVTTYAPGPDLNGELPYVDAESLNALTVMSDILSSADYWTKLIGYISMEAPGQGDQGGMDMFDPRVGIWYKSVFQMFQDAFIEKAKIATILSDLTEQTLDKAKQRAACELAAGIIRASKLWSPKQLEKLWSWILPLVTKGVMQATPESSLQWEILLRTCIGRRDPKRVKPLIDFILSNKLDPNSSSFFAETKKLSLMKLVTMSLGFRLETIGLVDELRVDFPNPYQQVREVLGGVWNELLQLQGYESFATPAETVQACARHFTEQGFNIGIHNDLDSRLQPSIDWLVDAVKSDVNASKATMAWFAEALSGMRVQGSYPLLTRFIPLILDMSDNSDQDLQTAANVVLTMISSLALSPVLAQNVLQTLLQRLATSNWHQQLRILPMIQVLYFNHLFTLPKPLSSDIVMAVSILLSATQVEVRELAATTLSGLVRCSGPETTRTLLTHFEQSLRPNLKNKAPDAVLKRHAAVLGLSALVQAFPYEVPEWMPAVLVTLSNLSTDSSGAIVSTVKKTFADFKRTHQDTWHEDKEKFTPDELEAIADVVSGGNYYA